ncbi:hypothetical protein C1H46_012791 [Malus baccata]|uniref:FCP1 homology domain-containing protein n=1 Tax=Malus baccata TaxID=106549 RepID=A0A540MS14_MALBA|nr:hypothetical protein C1H46_012791 [Malus baccata]
METAECSEKTNSQSEREDSEKLSESRNDALLEEPSVNLSADLPLAEALPSVLPKRQRNRARSSSAKVINNLGLDLSDNTDSVPVQALEILVNPVESQHNVQRSHSPSPDDSDLCCLKGTLSVDSITPEKNSCVQSLGRDAHQDSSLGTDTLLEDPSMSIISDLVPAELPPYGDLSNRKRKKDTISVAPESEDSCPESCAEICTVVSEKEGHQQDLIHKQKKKRNKQNQRHEIHENNDKSCDISVDTSLGETIIPTVDQSVKPSVAGFSEQVLQVAMLQLPMEGISTDENSKIAEPIEDLSCSMKKKKSCKSKTHEGNDENCGNDKSCELSVCISVVESVMPGVDPSQQPPVSESLEQKLELTQPLMEGIITKINSESSEPIEDLSSSSKKQKKPRWKKSNDESCGNDKSGELSIGISLVESIMPGIDPSQQPPDSEFSDEKLDLPQAFVEGNCTTVSSEGPKSPTVDLSCSQEEKNKNRKRRHKTNECIGERCDLSVDSSLGGNTMPGVDLTVWPPVAVFSEQDLEVEQPLVEGIRQRTNSESTKPFEVLSCSQKRECLKKRLEMGESNDTSYDPSVGTLVEKIIPGADPSLQPPLAIVSDPELDVSQLLLEERTLQEQNEDKDQNKSCNASGNNDTNHQVCTGFPGQVVNDVTDIKEYSPILKEQNGLQKSADAGSRNKINMEVSGTKSYCSDAFPVSDNITDTECTETKIEDPSLPSSSVKADVNLAVVAKEGSRSQISNSAVERPLVSVSKKKLLILDVNGLLADIVQLVSEQYKLYRPDTTISRKSVFKRPCCDSFLQFCFDNFNVGVWSSRTEKNVEMVVDYLWGDSRKKLLFCWNQSHCTTTKFNTLDNEEKPLVLKELKKLWEKHDPDLPWARGEFNETNTLLVDDSPYKALCNPENTAIFPYPFRFKDRRDRSLGEGGDIRYYLERLVEAQNVQEYVKQHPFGQRPITTKMSTSEDERDMNSYEDAANQFVCSPLLAPARRENAPLLQASQMSNGGAGSKLMVDSHRAHRLEICMKRTVKSKIENVAQPPPERVRDRRDCTECFGMKIMLQKDMLIVRATEVNEPESIFESCQVFGFWFNAASRCLTSEINRMKWKNIENLVLKLRRLNYNHDEASLCENTNPDHGYISEILLASGLLLGDLGSSLTTFQLHPSGHPINPELFYVLGQTKASSLLAKEECSPDKPDKLAKKTVNAQKLLKELSSEIEQLQAKKPECSLEDEDDGLKNIQWEDVVQTGQKAGEFFHGDTSGVVLDVERLIFKDLVNEIVIGEAAASS